MEVISPKLLELARSLRKTQTDAEKLLWYLLRNRALAGYKFRRQHSFGFYVLDFFCSEAPLCVELDGGQHNEQTNAAKDSERTKELQKAGIKVVRFWNHEVLQSTEAVLEKILAELQGQAAHSDHRPAAGRTALTPAPLPEGEG